MTDELLEQRLRAWHRDGDVSTAPDQLRQRVLGIADTARPARSSWSARNFALLAAAALLGIALVAGAVIGAGLLRVNALLVQSPSPNATILPPSVAPTAPVPTESASPEATDGATATPSQTNPPTTQPTRQPGAQQIAYTRITDKPKIAANGVQNCFSSTDTCSVVRVWLIGTDGSAPHELVADGNGYQQLFGWSPDGTYVLYGENDKFFISDVRGGNVRELDTGCHDRCVTDTGPVFSPDGQHLAFTRAYTDGAAGIAILELSTGSVRQLSSTEGSGTRATAGATWSQDGSQLTFWQPGFKSSDGPFPPVSSAIFVVNANGQNLNRISPDDVDAYTPAWSPLDSLIAFTVSSPDGSDVYTMRPDGTAMQQLTSDHASRSPRWTPDGRISFLRGGNQLDGVPGEMWVMDASGANAAVAVDPSIAQAQSVGLWQPMTGPAIASPPWPSAAAGEPVGPPAPTPAPTPTPSLAAGFSWTGSMLETQTQTTADTATTLNDGRVLVTISCDVAAQVYDPASGTFGATGTMTHARAGATATLLSDGRVLIVGGSSCDTTTGGILSSAEIYDPQAGTFSATGSMSATRMRHTATLLVDGRVLVAGGVTDQPQTGGTTIFAASYAAWVPAATAAGSTLATAELYDPVTGTFGPTGSMADFRSAFTATRLQDGRVLVVGGGGEGYARASAEIYDPATATFSPTGSMNKKRWLMTATLLLDGRVLVAGGRSPNDAPQATAEVFDPATGQFALTGPMSDIRQQHTASLLPDGRVLIAGGWWQDGSNWNILSSTELFDPGANSFASTGSMGDARSSAVAAVLNDGRVLIMGGTGLGTEDTVALTSAVLYAP